MSHVTQRTKRALALGLALASGLGAAVATGSVAPLGPPPIDLPAPQVAALSGIDVPITGQRGKDLIESAFGASPLAELIDVAHDPEQDVGVRLRAYRAIGLYETNMARTALTAHLAELAAATSGPDLLLLRAAIEALGQQHDPSDVDTLEDFLDFADSRDIRAATADALRQIGSTTAVSALQAQLSNESEPQVRFAIERALRDLLAQ
jgi:HEAT repeat protein